MAYIPKSQIKENQFASGVDWAYVKNNMPYTGFYYMLSNGKAYTGKNPNDPPNEEIINTRKEIYSSQENTATLNSDPQVVEYADNYDGYVWEDQFQKANDVSIYGRLTRTDYSLRRSLPQYTATLPTPEDYDKGMFVRYFVCKVNQLQYLEIDKKTYDNINTQNEIWVWEDYKPFTLDWYIKGNIDRVFNNNKGSIFIAEKNIKRKGLDLYLGKKYLQYFNYEKASNLQTLGGELLTPTGKDYIGEYHIHEFQGPMEGAIHQSQAHRKLFYRKFYRSQKVQTLNQEGVIETGETQNIEYRSILPPNPSSTKGGY
jgi:hypothetical protein